MTLGTSRTGPSHASVAESVAEHATTEALRATVHHLMPGIRTDLESLMRIPSISADPDAAPELRRSAELTAALFRDSGAADVCVLTDIPGCKPAVLARYPAPPGQPTVLLYAHHDVQPAGDLSAWSSPPFAPTERDGRLYGRGGADDKAGIAAHLAAVRAHGGRPPVGVTVLVEGEEEIGSPRLAAFLDRHREQLEADVIVLADADNYDSGTPSLTRTLRGLASCVVEVRTLERPVHSGSFGGAAPDALTALCRLLTSVHDDDGNVVIQGLGTGTAPSIDVLPMDIPARRFRAEAGVLDGVELIGSGPIADRIWARPAATVLAIDAPSVDGATNALCPRARAKLSLRLAPGDNTASALKAMERHLLDHAPWGVRVSVTASDTADPYAVEASGPAFDAARYAYGEAYGRELVEIGSGGSIPFVATVSDAFPDAAILVVSAGADEQSRPHSSDESLSLADLESACLAESILLQALARQPTS